MKSETVIALTDNFEACSQQTDNGIEFWQAQDVKHLPCDAES
jgi:hypothetical protein